MNRILLAAVCAAAILGCTAPQTPSPTPDDDALQVAATVAPHAWLVERIAGDDFRVVTALPATADPHSHTPTDAEVTRLANSRVLFRAGVPFENGSWLAALSARGVRLVDLRQGIQLLDDDHGHGQGHGHGAGPGHAHPHPHPHGPGQEHSHEPAQDHSHDDPDPQQEPTLGGDPHTWTSPRRLARQAERVAEALAQLRPERAEAIHARAVEVERELTDLDAELATRLAGNAGREFFVHHPSWSYFAADYGLVQVALEAGGSEPSDAELTDWLRRARNAGATVVFTQPQSADRTPRVAAEELSARVETLDPLAPDVPGQLRMTAERLLASWSEP